MKKLSFNVGIILVIISLVSCQAKIDNPKPSPQDNFIQVYFNHNQSKGANYTEPYRKIKRNGDNLEQIIINEINQAKFTIDLAIQELNLPKITQALIARHQAGIKVRIIMENLYNIPLSEFNPNNKREINRYNEFLALADSNKDGLLSQKEIDNNDVLIMLKKAGIPVIDDTEDGSKGSGLMHHKFMVIDKQKVITGSANFTMSGIHGDFNNLETRGNANHLLVINSQKLANIFTQEFNKMWGDGFGGKTDSLFGLKKSFHTPQTVTVGNSQITVKFSPNSRSQSWDKTTNGLIGKNLKSAFTSIDLALFVFSDQDIANIIEKRHTKGVKIRALIDKTFAFQYYSEGLDLLGIELPNKCRYEKYNNPWKKPIQTVGIVGLSKGDKLHHKFAIIDQEKVITGSHNWSSSANNINDETLLIIENPMVAAHFMREFEQLYNRSTLGIPPYLNKKIQKENKKCGL